jgi:hypothetical protein
MNVPIEVGDDGEEDDDNKEKEEEEDDDNKEKEEEEDDDNNEDYRGDGNETKSDNPYKYKSIRFASPYIGKNSKK